MPPLDLRDAWSDLRTRRRALDSVLVPYGTVLDAWAGFDADIAPLDWSAAQCRRIWEQGTPLVTACDPSIPREPTEALVEAGLQAIAAVSPRDVPDLEAFVRAWDSEAIGPNDLLPGRGRIGSSALAQLPLRAEVSAVIAALALRPPLEAYFARVRDALTDGVWTLGACPFCGAPPGFSDIVEDGRRRLACQVCGGAWPFSRTQCPFCGSHDTEQQVRLELGAADEGYFIAGCRVCSSYLKELDRRTRWNGGPALVEDWGSPHFDVAARRQGYARPAIALLELAHAPGAGQPRSP